MATDVTLYHVIRYRSVCQWLVSVGGGRACCNFPAFISGLPFVWHWQRTKIASVFLGGETLRHLKCRKLDGRLPGTLFVFWCASGVIVGHALGVSGKPCLNWCWAFLPSVSASHGFSPTLGVNGTSAIVEGRKFWLGGLTLIGVLNGSVTSGDRSVCDTVAHSGLG